MKCRIYLRIAKGKKGFVAVVNPKPNYESIKPQGYGTKPLPTVLVALDLDIPDSEFEATRILLETKIQGSLPAVEIKQAKLGDEK